MKNIEKFVFPGLLLLAGLALLIKGVSDDQSSWFVLGGVVVLITGVILLLLQMGIITRKIGGLLGLVFLVGAVALAWMNYRSVVGKIEYDKKVKMVNSYVIQGLKDVRTAQLAYRNNFGRFTPNPDTLTQFVKTGELRLIKAEGQVPDTLSELEALELGIIKRDTLFVNALDSLFLSKYVQKDRLYPFSIDSLTIARFSGKQFMMQAGIVSTSGRNVPVFEVVEPDPIDKKAEPLKVGSMERATSAGNWSGE